MSTKDGMAQTIIQLGSEIGKFTASKGDDTDLIIDHKIVDAEYYKLVGKEKILKTYRAYLLFDQATREAKYNEELTEESGDMGVNLGSGTVGFGASKKMFRGKVIGMKESGKVWGLKKEDLTPGKVVDYSFDVKDIRQPIEQALATGGWKLVQVVSRKDVSYPKKKGLVPVGHAGVSQSG
jgi:hypothetical protein